MSRTRKTKTVTNGRAVTDDNLPSYELRRVVESKESDRLEVWQLPSAATPRLKSPKYVAALKGRTLRLIEPRLLKRLAAAKVKLGRRSVGNTDSFTLDEDQALNLGLLFRVLAPMRSLDRIRQVADGVDEMTREEAGYWLAMAMHRQRPRRVLAALRMLLTEK